MKPKTGFELILNYSSQCNENKLKNDSSAGANAASRVNTKFSACDPLSEIVWSPDKGYSLKCVDSSFTNKNTSLFQDVEPSSMVLALLQSVTCTTDKPIDDVFVQPLAVICAKSNVSSSDTPVKHPTSYSAVIIPECKPYQEHDAESSANLEKMNSARGTPNLANYLKENLMSHWEKEKNICAQANIETAKICKIMEKENKSSTISGRINRRPLGSLLVPESESKPSMEQNPSPRKHCKEGMDTRVEHLIEDKGSGALGTYLISSGIRRSKKMELAAEKELKKFNYEATSAAKSRISVLKEENDSHLSCENYHSTELFLSSRKRCKQQVILGSKKVKMEIQETSYSKSYVKRDSSFTSLFSNMMKGYLQSSQEENKSLPLAHENRDHRLLQPHKDQDQKLKNSFKSYFKSTHCQSVENFGTIMSHQEEDDAGASLQLQIRPINFLNSHEDLKNNTLENENCYNMVLSKEKEGVALHSPSRQNKNNNENVESLELYERKEIGHKNDTTEDLWITRFSPKSIVSDNLTERGGFQTTSTYCSMLTEKHISHLNNCKVEETKEQSGDNKLLSEAKSLKNCCIDKEASICPKVEKKNNDHISKYKVNHVTPFKRLSNYEPMVSMFARRLGAIKQCQQN